jgi:glycosyltransferase involved in cell wall biosynthesis
MRVGINIFELSLGEGSGPGAGVYVLELLRGLLALPPSAEYFVFVNQRTLRADWLPRDPRCHYQVVPLDERRKWTRPAWEQLGLPIAAHRLGLDLLHSPFHTCPLVTAGLPVVVTVHDLAYFFYREHFPAELDLKARYYTLLQPLMLRRAQHIITASQFMRAELVSQLGLSAEMITAILDGPGQVQSPAAAGVVEPGQSPDLLLTIASGLLHKNLPRLLEAFAQANLPKDVRLMIAGEIPEHSRPRMLTQGALREQAQALGVSDRVTISGYVPASELACLYRRAIAFVFPSLYEGFGLPLLEAMHWGVPILCARSAALPEVAGQAALYFDPTRPIELAGAMEKVVADPIYRQELAQKGRERLATFSWQRTAAQTLTVYEKLLARHEQA